jgi:transposase
LVQDNLKRNIIFVSYFLSMKNKYIYHSKINERKFRYVLRLFSLDIEAKKTAELTGISRPTINKIYDAIRKIIAEECERFSPFETGEIELDESYFGARRVRGVRGQGAQGKTPVFGMLNEMERYILKWLRIALCKS